MAELKRNFYDSGELESEVFEINGIKHGIFKSYWQNGQINIICSFIDDKINGEYKQYQYYTKNPFIDSTKNEGLLKTCNYINDKLNGECKIFHQNGNLKEICNYIDDKKNGEFKTYYENGNLKEICNYNDNVINGNYKLYDRNGFLIKSISYNDEKK
jgi:antitoxin component YwqK of YwqJK toxin-antitoxin module